MMARLLTEHKAAAEIGLEPSIFRHWVETGRLPKPLPGTDRYDLKACHAAIDALSGLDVKQTAGSALDAWKAKRGSHES